jgi:hypothetical protein
MPNDLYKKASDPTPFKPMIEARPSDTGDPEETLVRLHEDTAIRAHQTAVDAGGFKKHGANGNMVHSKSSAIAPHDKDK